jgi:signal recognition particle subunit SRP54
MLQQMQRQMRSGGGMQEMMKAMMQGQGGDQMDMEEMQRKLSQHFVGTLTYISTSLGMMSSMGNGLGGLEGLGGVGGAGGMPGMGDIFKMMGMGR